MIDQKALFPIGTISEQTGVNTVTLRAWERRYGLLKPHRTPKGHRLYTPEDVERVKQVLILLDQGVPVSRVREVLDNTKTRSSTIRAPQEVHTDDPWRYYRNVCQRWIRKLDARALEQTFNEVVSLYSLDRVGKKLLLPLYYQLKQQSQDLPSTTADFAFLHEFLCAKLGSRYLHANNHASTKRILMLNTESMSVESLLLANILSSYGYQVSLLGKQAHIDHLPLILTRTQMDALLFVGTQCTYEIIETLVETYRVPVFLYPDTKEMVCVPSDETAIYLLPEDMSSILKSMEDILTQLASAAASKITTDTINSTSKQPFTVFKRELLS